MVTEVKGGPGDGITVVADLTRDGLALTLLPTVNLIVGKLVVAVVDTLGKSLESPETGGGTLKTGGDTGHVNVRLELRAQEIGQTQLVPVMVVAVVEMIVTVMYTAKGDEGLVGRGVELVIVAACELRPDMATDMPLLIDKAPVVKGLRPRHDANDAAQ